jgi:2-dehydropantoate 2-reductase
MRYVIFGAGAVGGVIGARLALAGKHVTLVARGTHLEAIRARGLQLETPEGRTPVRVPASAHAGEVHWRPGDVVLLAVKSQHTAVALADLAAHAPADVVIVTAQNGVANEPAVLRQFADVHALCVMQPCTHLEPGVVVQQSFPVPGILDVGRFPGGVDSTDEAIAADLQDAGFVSEPRADIMAWKYRKLVLNLGNAVQACFAPGPDADELQRRARAEGEAVLAGAGIAVVGAEEDAQRRGDLLQGRTRPDAWGSTWQSLSRQTGEVETDWLNGEIVLLGRLHGVPTPANVLLQQISNRLARRGGAPRTLDAATALAQLATTA